MNFSPQRHRDTEESNKSFSLCLCVSVVKTVGLYAAGVPIRAGKMPALLTANPSARPAHFFEALQNDLFRFPG